MNLCASGRQMRGEMLDNDPIHAGTAEGIQLVAQVGDGGRDFGQVAPARRAKYSRGCGWKVMTAAATQAIGGLIAPWPADARRGARHQNCRWSARCSHAGIGDSANLMLAVNINGDYKSFASAPTGRDNGASVWTSGCPMMQRCSSAVCLPAARRPCCQSGRSIQAVRTVFEASDDGFDMVRTQNYYSWPVADAISARSDL